MSDKPHPSTRPASTTKSIHESIQQGPPPGRRHAPATIMMALSTIPKPMKGAPRCSASSESARKEGRACCCVLGGLVCMYGVRGGGGRIVYICVHRHWNPYLHSDPPSWRSRRPRPHLLAPLHQSLLLPPPFPKPAPPTMGLSSRGAGSPAAVIGIQAHVKSETTKSTRTSCIQIYTPYVPAPPQRPRPSSAPWPQHQQPPPPRPLAQTCTRPAAAAAVAAAAAAAAASGAAAWRAAASAGSRASLPPPSRMAGGVSPPTQLAAPVGGWTCVCSVSRSSGSGMGQALTKPCIDPLVPSPPSLSREQHHSRAAPVRINQSNWPT